MSKYTINCLIDGNQWYVTDNAATIDKHCNGIQEITKDYDEIIDKDKSTNGWDLLLGSFSTKNNSCMKYDHENHQASRYCQSKASSDDIFTLSMVYDRYYRCPRIFIETNDISQCFWPDSR